MTQQSSLDDHFFGPFSPRARQERARARALRAQKRLPSRAAGARRKAFFGHFARASRWSLSRSQRSSAFRSGHVPVFFALLFSVALLARGHDRALALAVLSLGGSVVASWFLNIGPSLSSRGSPRPGLRARGLAIAVFAVAVVAVASLCALDPAGF